MTYLMDIITYVGLACWSPSGAARAGLLLGWSRRRLGDAAGIPVEIVESFEESKLRGMPDGEELMREALETERTARHAAEHALLSLEGIKEGRFGRQHRRGGDPSLTRRLAAKCRRHSDELAIDQQKWEIHAGALKRLSHEFVAIRHAAQPVLFELLDDLDWHSRHVAKPLSRPSEQQPRPGALRGAQAASPSCFFPRATILSASSGSALWRVSASCRLSGEPCLNFSLARQDYGHCLGMNGRDCRVRLARPERE